MPQTQAGRTSWAPLGTRPARAQPQWPPSMGTDPGRRAAQPGVVMVVPITTKRGTVSAEAAAEEEEEEDGWGKRRRRRIEKKKKKRPSTEKKD